MKITIGNLKKIIKVIFESGGGVSRKSDTYIRNALSPDMSHREQAGSLGTDGNLDDISDHLEDILTFSDEFGPVPPDQNIKPYLQQDPYVRFSSPLPSSPIKR